MTHLPARLSALKKLRYFLPIAARLTTCYGSGVAGLSRTYADTLRQTLTYCLAQEPAPVQSEEGGK